MVKFQNFFNKKGSLFKIQTNFLFAIPALSIMKHKLKESEYVPLSPMNSVIIRPKFFCY